MATTLNRTFYGGSTVPGSGVYPEDVKILKVFANYAETDYNPLASSDTSVYIPTVDKHSHDDGNIVSIIDRVLAAGGSPIVTKLGAEFIYASGDAFEYKFVNVSGDNITEMTINRTTGTVTTQNNFLARPVEVEYGVSTASDVASIINAKGLPYMKVGDIVANLYKIEVNKYTFRTTHLRVDDDINYLDIVDYVVTGSTWTTVTKTVSSGETGTAYLRKVSSPASFDTTGLSGLQTVAGVNDVPNDGVYQVSVMLSVTPKTANATKSDLVFGFYGADGIGMADHTFHAVVDDSQTFAQQLSFSTTLNLKAGANSLKLSCDGLNTNYLVFVDDLTIAQLVNGVYHNGDDFDEVHTLPEAFNFNEDDGFLVDGATGGPRYMFWRTLINGILRVDFQSNPEYIYAITDDEDRFLFGIKRDGSLEWVKGLPEWLNSRLNKIDNNKVDKVNGKSLVDSIFANGVSFVSNDEFLFVALDANKNILFGVKSDGSFYCHKDFRHNSYSNEILRKINPLANKNVLIIGDSITDMGYWTNSLMSISGCKVYNRGVSGTTIADRSGSSQSFCQRFDLSESNSQTHTDGFPARENVDFVIVFGGTNDWGNSVPFGDFGENIDRATFFGALRYLINGLKTRYYGKPIFVMSPLNCSRSLRFSNWNRIAFGTGTSFDFRVNSQSAVMSDYTDIMRAVCSLYGVFFIDMFNCGISPVAEYDYNHYFVTHNGDTVPDGLHPNEIGSAIIAKYVYKKLLTFI